jgi:acetylornithine deacetylase/succinyl-diaminopimelate desuccinylase-like protein
VTISARLDEVYTIGGGPGANRPHPSEAEDEAHRIATSWLTEAGLDVAVDRHGNLLGRSKRSADVWVGSHLDTVPRGGRFDGALGVVAAIEAVERVGAGAVAVFRGEEVGCIGSRALVASGDQLPAAFLELHVEQGPVLASVDAPVGVVTGIVGYARGEVVLEGRAGHAGTTPMAGREDALAAAATEILRVRDAALAIPGAVATVGQVDVEPGGANVIPSRVRLSLDVRAPDVLGLDGLVAAVGFKPDYRVEPVQFAGSARTALADAIAARGLPAVDLPSGAGHDAGILAAAGVDAAMLFVRSLNDGVSHSPDELSSEDDISVAVDVLADALGRLTASSSG